MGASPQTPPSLRSKKYFCTGLDRQRSAIILFFLQYYFERSEAGGLGVM
jgi:hypothetical protein